jgi:SAM-dependent methyltransferase
MKRIVLFCAGNVAKKILSYPLKKGCSVVGIYDNDPDKWETEFCGYKVYSPSTIKEIDFDIIIISSTVYKTVEEITSQLEEMGIARNKYMYATCIFTIDYFKGELDEFFEIPKNRDAIPFKKGPADIYQHYVGETHKSHDRRVREGFFEKYCKGDGLDIGYGADIIVPECSGWDLRNGDAQYLDGIEDESFDFVYSSHCLEHMIDVRVSLKNWFRVVKKGGFLIIAIPHRDLYEKKKRLPSRWNMDHKHMFLIGKEEYPDTLDIVEEIKNSLSNYDIKYIKTCDDGHTITDPLRHSDGEYQIEIVIQKM